ncbi:glucokinase [Actinocorallia herbida]|uniref:Glucokinase n=1 Tax=Actinocorallia herbida TaxID=58109 RepID=A0A3N1CWS5_9ACTN|nr:ROK family protein [Actinocorallia herbida]ROO85714.1 glucokinase [Actinocorallia herbida]
MTPVNLGIDVGGTKIAVGVVDQDGQVVARGAGPTPRTGGRAVLDAVAGLAAEVAAGLPVRAAGVGVPGVVDGGGTIVSATDTLPGWAGTEVRAGLGDRLGVPVAVDNDVRVMALGEAVLGAARAAEEALFVSVGTGIGGAFTLGGRPRRGPHGTAGELAHLLVPEAGDTACGCGRRDHLEAVASGPAIAAAYRRRTGGDLLPLTAVAERMRAGDPDARAAVTGAARLLGRTLAGVLSAMDADLVVIGGGVAGIGAAFLDPLAEALRAEVLPPLRAVPVVAAELGTDAPLVGAALLAGDVEAVAR